MIDRRLLLSLVPAAALTGGAAAASSPAPWRDLDQDYVAFIHRQDPLRAGARGKRPPPA